MTAEPLGDRLEVHVGYMGLECLQAIERVLPRQVGAQSVAKATVVHDGGMHLSVLFYAGTDPVQALAVVNSAAYVALSTGAYEHFLSNHWIVSG